MLPVSTSPPLRIVALASGFRRWLLVLPVLVALIGSFFAVRWCLGNTFAQSARDPAVAQLAVQLAPADPQTHYTLGKLAEASLDQAYLETAVREYDAASRLAPDDYRLWLILGSAQEGVEDTAGAERSFRRALELAPSYSAPRWALGNFLLRHGDPDQAAVQLVEAAESGERYRRPVLGLLASYYGDETGKLSAAIGPRRELRRELVQFLLDQRDIEGAWWAWGQLSEDERTGLDATGKNLVALLAAAHRYYQAYVIYDHLRHGDPLILNQVENGGFEGPVETGASNVFGWRIVVGGQPQVALDSSQHHSGSNSLILVFSADGTNPLRDVVQLIAVNPASTYRLNYAVRVADLKGTGTVQVRVVNAKDGSVLAHSEPISSGSSDWRLETLEFTVPAHDDGIIVYIGAAPCQAETCPLFGRFWYDDFELQRTGSTLKPQG